MEKLQLLKLFDNPTRSQISWNLIVHKELSATQLTKRIGKNISTITRSLDDMKKANLVKVSRTVIKRNFQEKFWKLNPAVFQENLWLDEEAVKSLSFWERLKLPGKVDNLMIISQGIMKSVLDHKIRNRKGETNLLMFFLDKEGADLLNKELTKLIQTFLEENKSRVTSDLESINEDSFIFFLLSSQIKNTIGKI